MIQLEQKIGQRILPSWDKHLWIFLSPKREVGLINFSQVLVIHVSITLYKFGRYALQILFFLLSLAWCNDCVWFVYTDCNISIGVSIIDNYVTYIQESIQANKQSDER